MRKVYLNILYNLHQMNISTVSKALTMVFSVLLILSSCRTEPKVTKPDFKNAGSKTANVSVPVKLRTLNPISHRTSYSEIVYMPVVQPLLNYDFTSESMVPVLAKSRPEIKELTEGKYAGGTSYTYELREGAVWEDGSAVTAADVLFTVKAVFTPTVDAPVYPIYFADFKAIETDPDNPRKFTIFLDKKYFIGEEASGYIFVMPEYIFDPEQVLRKVTLEDLKDTEKRKILEKDPAIIKFAEAFNSPKFQRETLTGSGAYKFVEWETGQKVSLVKKKDWWGNQYEKENLFFKAYPDTIVYRIIPDQTPLAAAVLNEELDAAYGLNVNDFIDIRESERMQGLYNFYTPLAGNIYFNYLNTKSPFLTDKRVRQALAYLTDLDAIIENLYNGMAVKQSGPIADDRPYYNPENTPIEYDLDKAVALLKEAGWEDTDNDGLIDNEVDGKRENMVLNYVGTDTKYSKDLAAFLKESYKEAGIDLKVEIMDFQSSRKRQSARTFDIASGALGRPPLLTDYHQIYHTSNDTPRGFNRSGFGTAESDALLEKIQETLDETERNKLVKQFLDILYDEQPKTFTFAPFERIVVHKRYEAEVAGIKPFIYAPSLKEVEY